MIEDDSNRILSAHILGPHAEEVINIFSMAIRLGLTAKELEDSLLMHIPLMGEAYAGPASDQGPPSNVLPILYLEADSNGDLWILLPVWSPYEKGVVDYGRYLKT